MASGERSLRKRLSLKHEDPYTERWWPKTKKAVRRMFNKAARAELKRMTRKDVSNGQR